MFNQNMQIQKIGAEKLHDGIEQIDDCEVFLDGEWRELEHISNHDIVNGVWSCDETIKLVCGGRMYVFERMDELTIRYLSVQRELDQHLQKEPRCLKRNGFIVLNKRNGAWLEWAFRRAELARALEYRAMVSRGMK